MKQSRGISKFANFRILSLPFFNSVSNLSFRVLSPPYNAEVTHFPMDLMFCLAMTFFPMAAWILIAYCCCGIIVIHCFSGLPLNLFVAIIL